MNRSNVSFLDLPNEILFYILNKLNNIDVLYSLLDVDNQRLDMIVEDKTFTKNLNFVLTMSTDDIYSIGSMEGILRATDYPNLDQLKLFNFDNKIASHYFTDCLALLDGRLNQLNSFFVEIFHDNNQLSIVNNMNDLPNLKYFSLKYFCVTEQYDSKILPLLRRMSNLEELTLYVMIQNRIKFLDGTQINNQILVHMTRFYKFIFYISTEIQLDHFVPYLSIDDIQQTFINIGYDQVSCIISCYSDSVGCHVFSLPFMFDSLRCLRCSFIPT
ncbi:unnamed protein product [Rotaria sordida]|uniref:F-box domain-containing protein n=1 Tax=Rotaria sordida TaxID=392033 RepID=A0A819W4P5_9BILA|nr:unnamed protein product [Rotaria sordida]